MKKQHTNRKLMLDAQTLMQLQLAVAVGGRGNTGGCVVPLTEKNTCPR